MTPQPPSLTVPGLIHAHAEQRGANDAVVSGALRLSYAQLRDESARAARGLQALGVRPGDRVALLMGNRAEWIVATVAIGALGATVVALNTWWTASELAYALDHAEARFLICTPRYVRRDYAQDIEGLRAAGRLPRLQAVIGVTGAASAAGTAGIADAAVIVGTGGTPGTPGTPGTAGAADILAGAGAEMPSSWLPWHTLLGGPDAPVLPSHAQPQDLAFLLYTSGSTSAPKGVQLLHGDLVRNTWQIGERLRLGPDDRLWLAVSLFWGFGCSNALPAMLSHGGCIVLQESFDPAAALALIERERCTVLYGTPNMVQALVEHPARARHDLSSLRTGATLGSPDQLRRAASLAPQVCNVYGLTEIYGNCHATSADDPLEQRISGCGLPLPGVSQRIVDPDSGRVLGAGEVGEIRVRGHVTPGYLKDPAQTAAAFDADGFFRTGDLGCVDAQGRLQFRGRLKELVKTGGINVSPAEIEAVLMAHPAVEYALVAGVPDAVRDEVLGAVVIPRTGCTPSEEELRSHCKRQLAPYKIPALIRFSTEEALPLTTTGKVQKNRLATVFFGAPA